MTLQTCPRCGAHNSASAVACLTCGGAFGGSSSAPGTAAAAGHTVSPSVATAPPPAATGLPPAPPRRADMAFDRPWTSASPGSFPTSAAQPARTAPLLTGIVAAVVALAVGGWFMLRESGGLPGSIAGMERLDSAEAQAFEEQAAATEFAGITFQGAMYGSAGTPELIVELIDGVPEGAPVGSLDEMFDSMGEGFASSSGGTVTLTAKASQSIEGVDYICAPFHASDPTAGELAGSVCLWHGDGYGLIATLRNADAQAAIADAQLVYDAVH